MNRTERITIGTLALVVLALAGCDTPVDNGSKLPTVSISAAATMEIEEGNNWEVTVTADRTLQLPLTIGYTIDGTGAGFGNGDYGDSNNGSVTIAANGTSAEISITILRDSGASNKNEMETISVTLTDDDSYTVGTASVGVTIVDSTVPAVFVRSSSLTITEQQTGTGAIPTATVTFAVDPAPAPAAEISITYAIASATTAIEGMDYTRSDTSGTRTITSGATETNIMLTALNDMDIEGDETIVVTIVAASMNGVAVPIDSGQSSVTVTITDNDGPTVSVMPATASVTEGDTVSVRFVADATAAVPVTVDYSINTTTSTATITDDYTGAVATGGMVTIPAGSMEATLEIMAVLDTVPDDGETIIITADSASRNDGGTPAVAASADSTTITINDIPDEDNDGIHASLDVDDDGDGLIEIATLEQLNNMRHNLAGTSYDDEAADSGTGDAGDTTGCGDGDTVTACNGYELVVDLDFDIDGDGTWSTISSVYTLDADDDNDTYFDVDTGGWRPIGRCVGSCADTSPDTPFTAIFEGNGHTIHNLAMQRSDHITLGLFGHTTNAQIRNTGLQAALVDHTGAPTAYMGGLVGSSEASSIVASWATTTADGGTSTDNVGGLVGRQDGGSIVASWATTTADGGASNDFVGGLTGRLNDSSIVASWANTTADGGTATDSVGGLVGRMIASSIVASWATGTANGGADDSDTAGGLIGVHIGGSIVASWADTTVDGGAGADSIGKLVAARVGDGQLASYGFGDVDDTGDTVGINRSADACRRTLADDDSEDDDATDAAKPTPQGVRCTTGISSSTMNINVDSATDLTVEASSNTAANRWSTRVWDFGTAAQKPALKWITGYDSSASGDARFTCDQTLLSSGRTCGALMPDQR